MKFLERRNGCVVHFDRNPVGKPDDDTDRNVLDQRSGPQEAEHEQQHACNDRADREIRDTITRDDPIHDDDVSAGWPADLDALPPNAAIRKPAMIDVQTPASGETPDAMANAIAKGNATTPTVTPAAQSRSKASSN